MENVYRHPEWKRLYDSLLPLLVVNHVFDYDTIHGLMDADPRTGRGRRQFYRCAVEIAKDRQFQFECVRDVGYRVVADSENPGRMNNRIGRARRRLKAAKFIGENTNFGALTSQQRAALVDILARNGRMVEMLSEERKQITAVISNSHPPRLPHPLRDPKPS